MNYNMTIDSSISHVNKCIESNKEDQYKNDASDYLPIGPGEAEKQNLDWDRVNQTLIEDLFQLSIGTRDRESLRKNILKSFGSSRDTRELVEIVDELYLSSNAVKAITPLAYLVSNQGKVSARTKAMINVVQGLLNSPLKAQPTLSGNNPLESLLIEKIHALCQSKAFDEKRITYLPFLADMFSSDIKVLLENPSYFLSELESFLNIYTFLYLTQLTIQLCITDNRYKVPSAKPLYFILETERASRERHECNQYGYDYLFSKTRGIAFNVFPNLGYFGCVSEEPSWMLINNKPNDFVIKVNELNQGVASLFGEIYRQEDLLHEALNTGLALQKQIFEKSSRKDANNKVVGIFEKIFSAEFITDRKSAGKYFVLNSNVLLLLTNIVIDGASENKLLIDDVIEGFERRGIWLDLKSRKALLKFYENVGNIEKLSDSGDAVYVKTTI
ncbi:MAG: DNA phosphorothioation-dependent restriction protein DptG [Colwellia sp.]